MAKPRGRHFAMMPCDMDTWDGWTDLTMEEQWAYKLLRRQKDVTAAGTIRLALNRWASEAVDADAEKLRGLLLGLASKDYIVVDFDWDEVLLCWFIATDHVYMKPNSLTNAATAIDQVRSSGIKAVLHNELKALLDQGDPPVPVPQEHMIRYLIGQLESFALIGVRQPLHNPSTRVVLPVSSGSAGHVEDVYAGSAIPGLAFGTASFEAVSGVRTGIAPVTEPPQTYQQAGQNNRCAGVPSITSLPVGGNVADVKPKTANVPPSAAADAAPAEVAAADKPRTAQTLLAGWIDAFKADHDCDPPRRDIGRVAQQLGEMLTEGVDYDHVRLGLWAWHKKNLDPTLLPSVVREVMAGGRPARRSGLAAPGTGQLAQDTAPTGKGQVI